MVIAPLTVIRRQRRPAGAEQSTGGREASKQVATKSVKLKGATTPSPELRRFKCIQIYARLIQLA